MLFKQSERGQAVVVVIAVIVLLFGVAALAIDGGIIYTERRSAQNAADSSAITAALSTVEGDGDWYTAGINQALSNGYNNDGTNNTVQVIHPPTTGQYAGDPEYFHVIISSVSKPVFSQFIFSGSLENVVEATTRVIVPRPVSMGNALYAGSPDGCQALSFTGNISANITGGDIFSNSDADGTDGASCVSGVQSGSSGQITMTDGTINVAGSWIQQTGDSVVDENGDPLTTTTNVEQQPIPPVPTPGCGHLSEISFDKNNPTLSPGIYTNIIRITNGDYTMDPGMYCLENGITLSGGSLVGDGVFIYVSGGDVAMGGNAFVDLRRSKNLLDSASPQNQWAGMLFYMDYDNTGIITLSGSGGSLYAGAILAPGPASPVTKTKCTVSGSSAVEAGDETLKLYSQLICYSIVLTGTSDISIIFNEEDNYILPPTLELVE